MTWLVQEPSVEHGIALPERGAATRMSAEVAPPLLTTSPREPRFAQLGPEPDAPQAVLNRAPPAFGQAKSNRVPGASAFAGVRSGDTPLLGVAVGTAPSGFSIRMIGPSHQPTCPAPSNADSPNCRP